MLLLCPFSGAGIKTLNMQLSETTNQSGLVQRVEKWTRRPYGSSGDELREIINGLNRAFETVLPMLLSYNDLIRWDDTNHTDAPVGTINLVANQNDYKITVDDNSLDILNIVYVRIFADSGDTQRVDLKRITADDPRVPEILNPNTAITGTPTAYLELGNRLYLDILPDESITDGIEIGFARQQQYFTVTGTSGDDSTEAGFPLPFHELLALYAALDWNSTNRSDDTNLLIQIEKRIAKMEKNFKKFINMRNPAKARMTMKKTGYI